MIRNCNLKKEKNANNPKVGGASIIPYTPTWDLFLTALILSSFVLRLDSKTRDATGTAYAFTGTPLNANIPRSTSALQMSSIKGVKAREILDSRGNPTVEVRKIWPIE